MGLFSSSKEELFGMEIVSKNIEGMPFLVLHSQLLIKGVSTFTLRRISTSEEVEAAKQIGLDNAKIGDVVLLPEAHRLNDIKDLQALLKYLNFEK